MPVSAVTIDKESLREFKDIIESALNINKYAQRIDGHIDHLSQLIEKRDDAEKKGIDGNVIAMYNKAIEKEVNAITSLQDFIEETRKEAKKITNAKNVSSVDKEFLEAFIGFKLQYQQRQNEHNDVLARIEAEKRKTGGGNPKELERLEKIEIEKQKSIDDLIDTFKSRFNGEGGYGEKGVEYLEKNPASLRNTQNTIKNVQEANIRSDKQISDAQKSQEQLINSGKEAFNKIKQIGQLIWKEMKDGIQMWMKFDDQAISTAKRLGMTSRSEALGYTKNLIESSKELARNFGLSAEQASKMRDAYIESTGRATLLSRSQMEDVAAASKLMGQETVQGAIKVMDSMGATSQQAVEVLDKTYARAKNTGLDTEKASKALVENLSLANKLNFRNGVDGISKMTVYSQRIKMNLQEVANVADKFSTIEGAIEGSARLQMLGGTGAMLGSNPMAMMYEALADPEALFKRMGDMFSQQAYFDRAKGESVIDPVQMQIIREQARAIGMNPDEAIQSAKQQGKLRAIESDLRKSRPALYKTLTEDQKAAIGNKAEYSKESGFTITYFDEEKGEDVTAKVNELTADQLEKITKDNLDPVKDIRDNVRRIAHELVSFRETKDSMADQIKMGKAQLMHTPMSAADKGLKGANDSDLWGWLTNGGWGTATLMAGSVGLGYANIKLMEKLPRWIGKMRSGSSASGTASGSGRLSRLFGGNKITATKEKYNLLNKNGSTTRSVRRWKAAKKARDLEKGRKVASEAKNAKKLATTVENLKGVNALSSAGEKISIASNAAKSAKTAKTLKNLYSLSKFKTAMTGSGSMGPLAIATEVAAAGLDFWMAGKERKADKEMLKFKAQQKNAITGRARYDENEIKNLDVTSSNKEKVKKGGAVGQGIGAVIGGAIGVIGGPIGMAAGAAIGGAIGRWAGKKLTPEKNEGVVGEHIKEINKDGVKDNLRRIVLPVESIDYNVSLIANQLGIISATPSRGNVYLEAESAGEKSIEVESTHEVQSRLLESSKVNEVDSQIVNNSQIYQPRGPVTLNVSGSIDLKYNGTNVGSITPEALRELIKNNPSIQKEIVEVAFNGIQRQSNASRTNRSPYYMQGKSPDMDQN